jgi:hypothetical protein
VPISRHKIAIRGGVAPRKLISAVAVAMCCGLVAAQAVPLPRPRPALPGAAAPDVVQPKIAQPDTAEAEEAPPPSACRLRLTSDLAIAPSLPPLVGAGECGVEDVVRLEAVVLADKTRSALTPPATVRCTFAEAIVQWVREDVVPRVKTRDATLRSIDNFDSYDCRGRNRVVGAKISEHGKANALDVRSVRLTSGAVVGLTDPGVSKDLREGLRKATCTRFHTVLGPGSDGYHEDHVHMDLAERRGDYRICHWDVRVPEEAVIAEQVPLPRPRPTVSVKQQ